MSQQSTLEITDRNGWRKDFPLTKTITNIGSDPRNDIVLETWRGTGVAPRHLQLIFAADDPSGQEYRLVNLGDTDILLGSSGVGVAPRSTAVIADNQRIRLGDFDLVLRAAQPIPKVPDAWVVTSQPVQPVTTQPGPSALKPAVSPGTAPGTQIHPAGQPDTGARMSKLIGLHLSVSGTRLSPDHPVDGWITVRNQGERPGVQFKIEVEGLDPDICEIGSAPILFPGAEKAVPIRLRHARRPAPPAGEYELRIRVTAPEAYPGERAEVLQRIEVLPFRGHALRILSEDEARTARSNRE